MVDWIYQLTQQQVVELKSASQHSIKMVLKNSENNQLSGTTCKVIQWTWCKSRSNQVWTWSNKQIFKWIILSVVSRRLFEEISVQEHAAKVMKFKHGSNIICTIYGISTKTKYKEMSKESLGSFYFLVRKLYQIFFSIFDEHIWQSFFYWKEYNFGKGFNLFQGQMNSNMVSLQSSMQQNEDCF